MWCSRDSPNCLTFWGKPRHINSCDWAKSGLCYENLCLNMNHGNESEMELQSFNESGSCSWILWDSNAKGNKALIHSFLTLVSWKNVLARFLHLCQRKIRFQGKEEGLLHLSGRLKFYYIKHRCDLKALNYNVITYPHCLSTAFCLPPLFVPGHKFLSPIAPWLVTLPHLEQPQPQHNLRVQGTAVGTTLQHQLKAILLCQSRSCWYCGILWCLNAAMGLNRRSPGSWLIQVEIWSLCHRTIWM